VRTLIWTVIFATTAIVIVFHLYVIQNSSLIIANRHDAILGEARLHFENLVNMRKWNAQFGGVYVKPVPGLVPNPYLKENHLTCDDGNRTLIKINPAWMTRQLSEIETIRNLRFAITSLKPLNPANAPDPFEKEGLETMQRDGSDEFYRFDDNGNDFHYIGALKVTTACLACHASQGYRLGDLRGGIHIELSDTGYGTFVHDMNLRRETILGLIYGFGLALILVAYYAYRKHSETENLNRSLEQKVFSRTQELHTQQSILREMFDRQPEGLMLMEGEKIVDVNKTLLQYCALDDKEAMLNGACSLETRIMPVAHPGYLSSGMNGMHWSDFVIIHPGMHKIKLDLPGRTSVFEVHGKLLHTLGSRRLKLITLSDITQHEQLVADLTHTAQTDKLTGLYNRKKFDEAIERCLQQSPFGMMVSLIMIDIDYFKNVNDTLGHATGDRLLVALAKVLSGMLREQDLLVRWGGEEFVVILYHTTLVHASEVAEKLRLAIERTTFTDGLHATASFGVTQITPDDSAQSLLERVDQALYRAKEEGRNRVVTR